MWKDRLTSWRRLDNAAKIFPATSGNNDTRVFRFACELKETVDPLLLKAALEQTMEVFPFFRCVLRKGVFWYYLEDCDLEPEVREEYRPLCDNLYIHDRKNLLFEVTYYRKRINFEVFHALTDGTGALQFLKTLVCYYLILKYPEELGDQMPDFPKSGNEHEHSDDSFRKFYDHLAPRSNQKESHAYQLKGAKLEMEELQLIEGVLSVKEVLAKARSMNTTMTVFLTAVLLASIEKEMSYRDKRHPIYLMIPINLRNYFPSDSMRNFFGWVDLPYQFSTEAVAFEDILNYVRTFFKEELTAERVQMRMNALVSLEYHPVLRFIPLMLKSVFLTAATKLASSKGTAVFSNIGVIKLPEAFAPYIELFDIFTSTPKKEVCMCSFQDRLVLSFTSRRATTLVEQTFFRMLAEMGLHVEISARELEKEPKQLKMKKSVQAGNEKEGGIDADMSAL